MLGLTRTTVEAARKTPGDDPSRRKFLGIEGGFGKMLGDDDWSFRIIRDVGNTVKSITPTSGRRGSGRRAA